MDTNVAVKDSKLLHTRVTEEIKNIVEDIITYKNRKLEENISQQEFLYSCIILGIEKFKNLHLDFEEYREKLK